MSSESPDKPSTAVPGLPGKYLMNEIESVTHGGPGDALLFCCELSCLRYPPGEMKTERAQLWVGPRLFLQWFMTGLLIARLERWVLHSPLSYKHGALTASFKGQTHYTI